VRAARSTASRNRGGAAALLLAAALGLAACENFVLHGKGSEHGVRDVKAGVRF
jgi:hypothetical protein